MVRALSTAVLEELYAQTSDKAFLTLVTITHSAITTLRLVNNNENISSNGQTFYAFPFQIILPDDLPDRSPRASFVMANITRELVAEVRTIDGREKLSVRFDVILDSDPDTLLVSYVNFTLSNVQYNADIIQGDLTLEDFLAEPIPGDRFTPSQFPALF